MNHTRPNQSSGFTLIELLAVVAIVSLLLAVVVPAFSSVLLESTETLAKNRVRFAIAGASDAALRNGVEEDTCAAFFYDPRTRRMTIRIFRRIDSLLDTYNPNEDPDAPGTITVERDVFVPDGIDSVFEIPELFAIRGYVPAGWLVPATNSSDAGAWYSGTGEFYEDNNQIEEAQWVFPENFVFDAKDTSPQNGAGRHTFIIRFEGSTGRRSSNTNEVLLVDPGLNRGLRSQQPYRDFNIEDDTDITRWAQRVLNGDFLGERFAQLELIGDRSVDTVLARPVPRIALYKPLDLAASLNVRVNIDSGALYFNGAPRDTLPVPVPMWRVVDTGNDGGRRIRRFFASNESATLFGVDSGRGRLREQTR
ncbi:MAG: type II secretion system protein [Planctomycetota bacterium]